MTKSAKTQARMHKPKLKSVHFLQQTDVLDGNAETLLTLNWRLRFLLFVFRCR